MTQFDFKKRVPIKDEVGYSVISELPYVLSPGVDLPIFSFLTDDLKIRFLEVLTDYSRYCCKREFNPCATTTWPYYVDYIRKKRSNLFQRKFMNLTVLYLRSIRSVSKKCATVVPEVTFSAVDESGIIAPLKEPETKVSLEARWEQSQLKDIILDRVLADPRPVLDLGSGLSGVAKHFDKKGSLKEVVSVDILKNASDDFNRMPLQQFSGHQIVCNHSLYHMSLSKALEVLSKRPKGLTVVLDTNEDSFKFVGEDYEFTAVKHPGAGNMGAYWVSGNFFKVKSRGSKGRVFSNELWFTRKQWSDWGFSLFADPSQRSDFVRRHVVLFDGAFSPTRSIRATLPMLFVLTEGFQHPDISKKMPPLFELFQSTLKRDEELNCYLGHYHYHTPKLDGVNMKLTVDKDRFLVLTDRMGVSYRLEVNGSSFITSGKFNGVFSVELLLKGGTPASFLMYVNQVIQVDDRCLGGDALDEILKHVTLLNRLLGRELLGVKDYFLNRNKLLSMVSALPFDGVVYVSAYTRASDKRLQVHSFHKPLSGTDTIPYVLESERVRSLVTPTPYDLYYREPTSVNLTTAPFSLVMDNPYPLKVQKVMNNCLMNTSDFFGPTSISPLMYEGYYVPGFVFGPKSKDRFIVTHVRGDKERKDSEVKKTLNLDWFKRGVIGLTKWGDNAQSTVANFFSNLSSVRLMKILPSNVGVQSTFLANFMTEWAASGHDSVKFAKLNSMVVGSYFESSVDEYLVMLRQMMPYMTALYFLDTLFRFPFVDRKFRIVGKKVEAVIRVKITANFSEFTLDGSTF